jgi:hypothetical protein
MTNKRKIKMNNYISKIIKFAGEQKLQPGAIAHVQIAHDNNCPFLTGGTCNCNVDISLMEDPYKKGNRQQRRKQKKTKGKKA